MHRMRRIARLVGVDSFDLADQRELLLERRRRGQTTRGIAGGILGRDRAEALEATTQMVVDRFAVAVHRAARASHVTDAVRLCHRADHGHAAGEVVMARIAVVLVLTADALRCVVARRTIPRAQARLPKRQVVPACLIVQSIDCRVEQTWKHPGRSSTVRIQIRWQTVHRGIRRPRHALVHAAVELCRPVLWRSRVRSQAVGCAGRLELRSRSVVRQLAWTEVAIDQYATGEVGPVVILCRIRNGNLIFRAADGRQHRSKSIARQIRRLSGGETAGGCQTRDDWRRHSLQGYAS